MKKMMKYIKALELVNLALEHEILHEKDNLIPLYRTFTDREDGWYLTPKEYVIQELMRSEEGQNVIMKALSEKGVDFVSEYTEYIPL